MRSTGSRLQDRLFRLVAEGSGVLIIVLISAVGGFLLLRAIPALQRNRENFFTYGGSWVTTNTSAMHFGIAEMLQVTVFVSVFALVLAMPVALGVAVYLAEYAPRRLVGLLGYMVELLAAVPSIIYGAWGLYVLAPSCAAPRYGSTNISVESSCSPTATRRWRAAAPSSSAESCWR